MNKEEFLKLAQFHYYIDIDNSKEAFQLMSDDAKKLVIGYHFENKYALNANELEFYLTYCKEKDIKEYFKLLINEDKDLYEAEIEVLTYQQVFLWYDMLKAFYESNNGLEFWKNYYEIDYKIYKAKMRDKQIDFILNE